MKVIRARSYDEMSGLALSMVTDLLAARPSAVLGLPTGGTPLGFYRRLAQSGLDLRQVRTFNLDEYLGLDRKHPGSYHSYMERHLFSLVNLPPEHREIPDGTATDPDAECRRYEAAIRAAGGIDLLLLGLGHNGHIGFNEPGTSWESRTRVVRLSAITRRANARFFGSVSQVPREAITMGIGTILEARQILMLVSGAGKAETVDRFLNGPLTVDLPATALRTHPDVTVLLDQVTATQLQELSAGRS